MNIEKFVKEDMGVRVRFTKEGEMELNCLDLAVGLFTKIENKNGVEYESIRWNRIKGYVEDVRFDHYWAKEKAELSWLPEGDFYKLLMKMRGAENEKVTKFQNWVAYEVLPSLRKNNYYIDNENITESQKDKLIQELTCINTNGSNLLLNNKKRRLVLEQCLEDMFPETPDIYAQFLNTMKTSGMLDSSGKPTERFKEYNRLFELFHYHEDTFIETKTHFTLTNKGINHLIQTLRVVDGKLIAVKTDK